MGRITAKAISEMISSQTLNLTSTHGKLSLPIINRMYSKMRIGLRFDAIKIYENAIFNGHHRYMSSRLARYDLDMLNYPKTSATKIYDWKDVRFVSDEWDTKHKIEHLNRLDADFNNMSINELNMKLNNI